MSEIFRSLRDHKDDRVELCCLLSDGKVMYRSGSLNVHKNLVIETRNGRSWRIPVSSVVSLKVLEMEDEEIEISSP